MNHEMESRLQADDDRCFDTVTEARRKILLLKELPPFPMVAQRILRISDDLVDVNELAGIIEQDPCLSARILGFANSAYFGWPGGVRTIRDAVYKVLGLKMLKNLALSLILGGMFRTEKCGNFKVEHYWFTVLTTGIMAQSLLPHISPDLGVEVDNIHLNGLLFNLGLPVLTHVFPREMSTVLAGKNTDPDGTLAERARNALGIDQYTAGGWLARKWHLPRDIVAVIEHHHDRGYRGEHWPIVLLVGYCARLAEGLFTGTAAADDRNVLQVLGMDEATADRERSALERQREVISDIAAIPSEKGARHE
jgi:HD-like signal output (HDOD) protein